jgi:hypothetical protein
MRGRCRRFHGVGYSGGVAEAAGTPVGLFVASLGVRWPCPEIPRWNCPFTSSVVRCSRGSAQPPGSSAKAIAHNIDTGFIRLL